MHLERQEVRIADRLVAAAGRRVHDLHGRHIRFTSLLLLLRHAIRKHCLSCGSQSDLPSPGSEPALCAAIPCIPRAAGDFWNTHIKDWGMHKEQAAGRGHTVSPCLASHSAACQPADLPGLQHYLRCKCRSELKCDDDAATSECCVEAVA